MNEITIKLFIYWLALVIIAFIVDFINRSINGKSFSDKGWSYYSYTNAFKYVLLYIGLFAIGLIVFIELTDWWFKL